jgi:hypothetical protein
MTTTNLAGAARPNSRSTVAREGKRRREKGREGKGRKGKEREGKRRTEKVREVKRRTEKDRGVAAAGKTQTNGSLRHRTKQGVHAQEKMLLTRETLR